MWLNMSQIHLVDSGQENVDHVDTYTGHKSEKTTERLPY